MAVRIRMKRFGRKNRPFYRICATDARSPRDGKVIEELGHYDPLVKETDARAILKRDRIDYWLSVGAQPSEKVGILIKKYGSNGSHVAAQAEALNRIKVRPAPPEPVPVPLPVKSAPSAAAVEESAEESAAEIEAPATEAADDDDSQVESET